ncbi:WD40 repeat domain-containing protein [Phenylobacterium hankyongense]|uniref:WD40 repeat domain-containing protein n=1 Tax=Phenylobacterium hankyongense TaxID=1813876 RepID=A0A328AZP5_9CAUL|nr:PD40 domain-containing protein [Phenylobacterium hankyongense]RAK59755.1 WD40 repeat domain-containing protein [Phenylobacterium hankyongense]
MIQSFDAYVTAALFDRAGRAAFALGDGTVRFEDGASVEAHKGAALAACLHPSGEGLLTGGDDGRLVWARAGGAQELGKVTGRWIESVAASAESGLIAFAAARELHVRDVADPAFARVFAHEKSVADLAFDPKGRRIAAATYNGVALWYARIADQKPAMLKWAGSHVAIAWSPDGKFLISAMQENQLHGWRVADEKNMRMGGYPAKVKSLAFLAKGSLMATSGANGVVVWPFAGSTGPMGKQAAEVGYEESATATRVAAMPAGQWVAWGLDDGRVRACNLAGQQIVNLKAEKGAPITALAMTPDGKRVAWGDEDGAAGVAEI